MKRRLYLSEINKKIAGVCGGIGEYFDIDPTIIRVGWVIFSLMAGAGVIGYFIAWIIIPRQSEIRKENSL